MKRSRERSCVAKNTIRARLTILGFNLAITRFQIDNTRGLGGVSPEAFEAASNHRL